MEKVAAHHPACILPTIMTMLILRMGSIFTVGYEKIMLMYNPATYETADVISLAYTGAFEGGGEYSFGGGGPVQLRHQLHRHHRVQ